MIPIKYAFTRDCTLEAMRTQGRLLIIAYESSPFASFRIALRAR
jgi:hypothetical protein